MTAEENKQTVQRAFEALIGRNPDPLRDLLAPDAVLHQCGFLEPIPARAIFQGEFPRYRLISDRHTRLERIVGEGDMVALHWYTTGGYSDPDWPDRDGTQVEFSSMSFVRLEAGRIAEIWNVQDTSTLQSQLR